MKRSNLHFILFIIAIFSANNIFAQGIDFGFHIGLSTPNDKISDVYNKKSVDLQDSANSIGKFVSKGMSAGYHIGVKGRISMSDKVDFYLGFGFNRFPDTDIKVTAPNDPSKVLATLSSSTQVIPINAGVNFYLLRSFIGLYATGDLAYNYVSSTLDYKTGIVDIPISRTPSDSRLGFGVGAGLDVSLGLILLNIEAKYNQINLIGKDENEKDKSYVSFGLGIYF